MLQKELEKSFHKLSKNFFDFSAKVSEEQKEMKKNQQSMHDDYTRMKKRIERRLNHY